MNTSRIALAAFCAFVAYFVLGGVAFTVLPIRTEFMKYPAVYRPQDGIKKVMPAGMAAMLVGMVVLAVLSPCSIKAGLAPQKGRVSAH